MLTYMQVHLYFLLPPIAVLLALYRPLLGRRDVLKILWLSLMATLWTTPWDNFILSRTGWVYPPNSIIGTIFLVPIEEHLFFILQPIFLVLLHALISHPRLLPFELPSALAEYKPTQDQEIDLGRKEEDRPIRAAMTRTIQTLPRRPLAAAFWSGVFLAGAVLINEAHGFVPDLVPLQLGTRAFYLGWILVWISPVIGGLSWLGSNTGRDEWRAWAVGSAWLCMVDTVAIRAGAWRISEETSLGLWVWRGLPLEEFLFFLLTSYLVVLSASLISHLHTLLLLSPALPTCPPMNPFAHIVLLARVASDPPAIDVDALRGLVEAEETLRKGSKSFGVAKLAFGREMRIGLVAIYAWSRVTDDLIDDPVPTSGSSPTDSDDSLHAAKLDTLAAIRAHLVAAYKPYPSQSDLDSILDDIPSLTPSARSAFHLFSSLLPNLAPIGPFLQLCSGYETDMGFITSTVKPSVSNSDAFASIQPGGLRAKLRDPRFQLEKYLPIKTTEDLLLYADDVAGSIALAICHLAWSILSTSSTPRPVGQLARSSSDLQTVCSPSESQDRDRTMRKARVMGQALQLVNIARDVAKDATIGRLYVPLSSFQSGAALLNILVPSTSSPSYAPYSLPLLDIADQLRLSSTPAMNELPPTARGGTRAMVASYFEIAEEIRLRGGEIDEKGVKVKRWRRAWAAAGAMWGWS